MSAAARTGARSDRELLREESAIARKYLGRVPWEMVAWGLGNCALWLSLWPLTLTGVLPLWAAFLLSTVCITLSYLPSHEAQHSIIAAEGTKLRWLNQLVGHVSTIPLVLPYRLAWITHRQTTPTPTTRSATRTSPTAGTAGGRPPGTGSRPGSPGRTTPTRRRCGRPTTPNRGAPSSRPSR
jgi:hypothetical protein